MVNRQNDIALFPDINYITYTNASNFEIVFLLPPPQKKKHDKYHDKFQDFRSLQKKVAPPPKKKYPKIAPHLRSLTDDKANCDTGRWTGQSQDRTCVTTI